MTASDKHKVAVVGAGKIGQMITHLLGESGDYQIKLIDQDEAALAQEGSILLNGFRIRI